MRYRKIEISAEELAELEKILRTQKSEKRMKLRAEIILLSSEGKSYEVIMEITGGSRVCVAK